MLLSAPKFPIPIYWVESHNGKSLGLGQGLMCMKATLMGLKKKGAIKHTQQQLQPPNIPNHPREGNTLLLGLLAFCILSSLNHSWIEQNKTCAGHVKIGNFKRKTWLQLLQLNWGIFTALYLPTAAIAKAEVPAACRAHLQVQF